MAHSGKEGSYEGRRYQFVEAIPVYLICKLCTGVVVDPQMTTCCGVHYCKTCVEKISVQSKPTCPYCRIQFNHWPDPQVDRRAKQLLVFCTYQKEGCTWSGHLSKLEEHLKSGRCNYSFVTCSCNDKILVRDLGKHLLRFCPMRLCSCEHCGTNGTHQFITGKHLEACLEKPTPCPNLCNSLIKKSKLEEHLSTCSCSAAELERVDCMYSAVGCTTRTLTLDQGLHLQTHLEQHSSMMLQSIQRSMEAVITESEFLSTLPTHTQGLRMLSVECVKTISGINGTDLKKNGPVLTLRMNHYSELKASGRHWRSIEFSINGCRMRVVAVASGIDEGEGTHLSVYLEAVRLNPHFCWTEGVLGFELKPQSEERMFVGSFWRVNAQKIPWQELEDKDGLTVRLSTCAKFVTHEDLQCGMLLSDSLVFQIKKVKD